MANKKKSRKLKSRMAELAEELGTFLGTSERKAKGWLSEQERLTKKLSAIRDQASALLSQLGTAVEKTIATAAPAKGKGKKADDEAAPKKGKKKSKGGKVKDGKAKKAKAKDSKPAPAVKTRKTPKPPAATEDESMIEDAEAEEPA